MINRLNDVCLAGLLTLGLALAGFVPSRAQTPDPSDTTYARFNTNLGNIDVLLLTHEAPLNTGNFVHNIALGQYNNLIVNRSVPNFIFQSGEYTLINNSSGVSIGANTPGNAVTGEHSLPGAFSNVRGTISFALGADQSTGLTDPNSGTNQWFFNELDNSASLDSQGFTVFGVVADASSLAVMDAIANVPVYLPPNFFVSADEYASDNNPNPDTKPDDFAFGRIPLQNYDGSTTSLPISDFVLVNSITTLTTLTNWQTAFQSDPNAAADSAPAATPQKDGTPNLLKYFCGINGNVTMSLADQAKLPIAGKTTISNAIYQTMTYHQRPGAASVSMAVQVSTDLVSWSTPAANTMNIVQTGTDSDGNAIMQVQVPAPTTGAQFLRLSLTAAQFPPAQ
jgi:cyclophilin family peptidyl-prolyl cis-trans isomerase